MSVDQRHTTFTSVQPDRATVDMITVDTGCVGDVTIVYVAGAVDMATVPIVKAALMCAVIGDTTAVVVDMNSVSFLACAGLQMLVETRDMARACQVALHLAVRGRAVVRPLELTGLLDAFLVHPSVSRALGALTPLPQGGGDERAPTVRTLRHEGSPRSASITALPATFASIITDDSAEIVRDGVGTPSVDASGSITPSVIRPMVLPQIISDSSTTSISP